MCELLTQEPALNRRKGHPPLVSGSWVVAALFYDAKCKYSSAHMLIPSSTLQSDDCCTRIGRNGRARQL